jgi:regulator of CtrA degradation
MKAPASINPRIVEALYCDALVLADEVRAQFDETRRAGLEAELGDDARVAVSCEGLRTTTRVMHCLAWLLNHRAFFEGEISEMQLRRHGRLIGNLPASSAEEIAALPPAMGRLVTESERLYARIVRLERAWRARDAMLVPVNAIERLRERLGASLR